jgi:formylglycine-generating enzyme required for sulfatase activity
MTHYDILDLPTTASSEQVRAMYRILVQLFHPDRLQHANAPVREYAEERLKKINMAYSVLSDPLKRSKYDHEQDIVSAEPRPKGRKRKARFADDPEPMYAYNANYSDEEVEEWMQAEMERRRYYDAQYEARQARDAEVERRRAAEERMRRAAAANLPRVEMLDANQLILQLAPDQTITLLHIPDGDFIMGSDPARDPEARPDEQPQHTLHLTDYFMAKYPVTNYQYQLFKEMTVPRKFGNESNEGRWQAPPGKEAHPVVNISWDDATAFCMWLSQETGVIFRLPTEAEWEKAARGSGNTRIYPWGNKWEKNRANIDDAFNGTTPVGQFSPAGNSPFEISDMAGNVWEWCADRYSEHEYKTRLKKTAHNPYGPEGGEGVVVRGGAYDKSAKHARCSHRNWYYPHNRKRDVGFRLVAEPF